jgi:hypothetical protein
VARLAPCLAAAVLAATGGCGGLAGRAYGCKGHVCTVSFSHPGRQDLSAELGSGALVDLRDTRGGRATVAVASRTATLRRGRHATLAGFVVTLNATDGDGATLRIVGPRARRRSDGSSEARP